MNKYCPTGANRMRKQEKDKNYKRTVVEVQMLPYVQDPTK